MTIKERRINIINNLMTLTQQAEFHKKQFEAATAQALQVQGALSLVNALIAEEEAEALPEVKAEVKAEDGLKE